MAVADGERSQQIRFCRSADGTRIAYARHGSGPPLVIATCWLSHLQHDWESPVWRHFLEDLGRVATVIRYDERSHGLSDRGVADHSLEARLGDLEAVVDDVGLDRFALMAMAQGGPVAITYAVRHPERVSQLVFYGSYAAALADDSPKTLELAAAFDQMIKVGWARPDHAFRRVFTSMMIPGANEEQMRWLDELQRVSVTTEDCLTARRQRNRDNVVDLLPAIAAPTLVIHARGDQMNDFADSRLLAAHIPGARLVGLDSDNHIVLGDEPAWAVFLEEVTAFLELDPLQPGGSDVGAPASGSATGTGPGAGLETVLSPRELEVLGLAAEGLDNDGIARRLVLSVRTVERHLQNIYLKLDVQGRSARVSAVSRLLADR